MAINLEAILKFMDKMPEPPQASVQAVGMLEDAAIPISKVAEFISMDECLTAKLLKLSNSASYGYSGKVITTREAMMRIGTNIVKATLYASMLEMSNFKTSPFFMELWKSALYCAFMSREIGALLNHPNKDLCFTAGLLADIGQLSLNEFAPDLYPKLLYQVREEGYQLCEAEQQIFGVTHTRIGVKMAEIWKLPAVYQNIIKYHHTPLIAHNSVLPDDYKALIAVHIASALLPLVNSEAGPDIQTDAFYAVNQGKSLETVLQQITHKMDLYTRNVEEISQSMFGTVVSAA